MVIDYIGDNSKNKYIVIAQFNKRVIGIHPILILNEKTTIIGFKLRYIKIGLPDNSNIMLIDKIPIKKVLPNLIFTGLEDDFCFLTRGIQISGGSNNIGSVFTKIYDLNIIKMLVDKIIKEMAPHSINKKIVHEYFNDKISSTLNKYVYDQTETTTKATNVINLLEWKKANNYKGK